MATQAETLVRIEKDGRQYAVTERAYKSNKMAALGGQTYQDAGYKVVSYEDGTPYGGEETPTAHAIDKNAKAGEIGANPDAVTDLDGEKLSPTEVAAMGFDVAAQDSAPAHDAPPAGSGSSSSSRRTPGLQPPEAE